MYKFIFFFSLLVVLFSCKEEVVIEPVQFKGIIETSIEIGGSSNETLQSVVTTNDGGIICLGYTRSEDGDIIQPPYGDNDYWILKYDNSFSLEWSKVLGGDDEDNAKQILQTQDGGYIISGFSKSTNHDVTENAGQKDFWIVKLNATGSIIWQKSYGFSGDDEASSVLQTDNGDILIVGYLDVTASEGQGSDDGEDLKNTNHGVGDYWVIRLNSNGDRLWRRYFGGSNNDRAYSITKTEDSGFIVAGVAESIDFDISNPHGSYDIWVIKVNHQGELIWNKSFGGSEIDNCFKTIPTSDGNYLLLGDTRSSDQDVTDNKGFADIWVIKITPQGEKIWQKTYGGSSFDTARSICNLKNGEYMIAGNSRSSDVLTNRGQNDIFLIRIDSQGNVLWQDTFGGTGIDLANDVIQTDDNSIIVVGESSSNDLDFPNNKGFTDAIILKLK